ncbi:hypothetical protein E8E14_000998 [Neopestalotiopsis sp. 37M]|nr:hypothetical protein E8E14_000998 [Neopestalotiopsis sp. 37M]
MFRFFEELTTMHPELKLWQVVVYGAILGIAYIVALVYYRLFHHPLKNYPGPFAAKLSDLYGAVHAYRADLHVTTLKDHTKFGPVIRHGPNKLVFSSIKALRDIYQNDRITKSRGYLISQKSPGEYGLFNALDRQLHQKKRKLVGRALAPRFIQSFEPTMIQQIDIFIQQLRNHCHDDSNDYVNVTNQTKYLSADIMGHLLFKYPLNLQTENTHRVLSYSRANFFFNVGMQLPVLVDLRIWAFQYLWSLISRKRYLQTLEKVILNCLSHGQNVKQELLFMSTKSAIQENDSEWVRDLRSEATWHMIAGSDTTSTTLSALFFYLSRNPKCYTRLCQEIRSAFPSDSEIRNGTKLAGCTYLRACLDETLRMSPALPGTLWREETLESQTLSKPLVIDGHVIPKGTHVGVNTYSLLHNEEYFRDPFTFKPERWLEGADPGEANREAFAPFSLGARGCLGKSIAYLETSLVTAKTLWHFDFEMSPRKKVATPYKTEVETPIFGSDEFPIQDTFSALHDGPYLRFHEVDNRMKSLD